MKIVTLKILFVFLIIPVISQTGFSQETDSPQDANAQQKTEARLTEEFGKICSEIFAYRYDYFLVDLQNDPSATGYIIFHGDKSVEGTNLNFISALTNYPRMRRFDISRLRILRGENNNAMLTQFWLVPAGAEPPKVETDFVKEKISSTTLFDKTWADFYKPFKDKVEIYADYFVDWGCEFRPNLDEFTKILLTDEDLTGYLVVYGNKKSRAEKVVKFAVNDLVKNYKIPRTRLKTIYGGKSDEPQIEFWFVPKNDKPPVINKK